MAWCGFLNKQESKSLKSSGYKENIKEPNPRQKKHFKIEHGVKVSGWSKSPFNLFCFVFFHKIKEIFILTNNYINLDIFSALAISRVVEHWFFSVDVSIWSLINFQWSTQTYSIMQWEIPSINLHRALLTRSQHLLHTLHRLTFTFLPFVK